jgi:geranylgeranyl pyrophosphate synthase
MCIEKTSKLFILTIRIAEEMAGHSIQHKAIKAVRSRVNAVKQYFPDTEQQAEDILASIGVVYQLTDDIANITIDIGKDFGEDIRERKITAPVLAAYKSGGPSIRKHLTALYRKRTISDTDTRDTIRLLIASNAISIVEERVAHLLEDCCNRLMACQLKQREQDLLGALALLAAKRT